MEVAPPSYDYATNRDHWSLIAPNVRSEDLASACRVSKSWHRSFAPQLWGNPSYHFTQLFEDPWLGFRKFERIAQGVARLELRQLTHTLHVPPETHSLHEEIYSSRWLYNILRSLPRLQSLLVPNVSSFDHETLQTVRRATLPNYEQSEASSQDSFLSTHHMRLLDASSCKNVTSTALLITFEIFPSLMYLDLSGVPAASFVEVPPKMQQLRGLKVLNLRRVRMTDDMLSILASGITLRVKSLDIRENPTTERSLTTLLEKCFLDTTNAEDPTNSNSTASSDAPPSYERRSAPILPGQDFAINLYNALTRGPINRLALEGTSETGISHLQMSMKTISARRLFSSFRFRYLQSLDIDCTTVEFSPQINIMTHSPENLKYLRVHHTLVTGSSTREPYAVADAIPPETLQGIVEKRKLRAHSGRTNFQNITACLHALSTLVLTGVPVQSTDPSIAVRLIDLLRNCAINSSLARAQARAEQYSRSEQSDIGTAQAGRAQTLFPLEKIVLELLPQKPDPQKLASKGWNYRADTKAVTEDRDSEALWAAGATDFSFFANDDNGTEPDVRLENPKTSIGEASANGVNLSSRGGQNVSIKIVDEITAYRKGSRKRYEEAVGRREAEKVAHEYWPGVISLVRN